MTEQQDTPRRIRPDPLNAAVSRQMSRMPRTSTGPEVALRRALHRLGLRFRLHLPLPGRPDIVLTRVRVAVFVDGCFWHRCPQHGNLPRNNAQWWQDKLDRNVARDRAADASLAETGWAVVRVWEHEDPDQAALKIRTLWVSRSA
jgi:DNA mismatch endonuclease (patch repair protein)